MRYSAIIRCLRSSAASLKEIKAYLENESNIQGYDLNISARTFQRDLDDIYSLYQIEIEYDYSRKKYLIRIAENGGFNERTLEAFETLSALTVSRDVSKYIDFEKRKSIGLENFHGLLHAIKNRLQLNFDYQSFEQDKPHLRKTNPFLLKEFRGRWYLIAKNLSDGMIKTYALDRLSNPEITKKKFRIPVEFNPRDIFKDSFGIISSVVGSIPEKVVLSIRPDQGKYLKTLPLHHSQKIIIDNETELRIQLKVYIAFDLVKELLSFGDAMKVIEPQSLIEELKEGHKCAFEQYSF